MFPNSITALCVTSTIPKTLGIILDHHHTMTDDGEALSLAQNGQNVCNLLCIVVPEDQSALRNKFNQEVELSSQCDVHTQLMVWRSIRVMHHGRLEGASLCHTSRLIVIHCGCNALIFTSAPLAKSNSAIFVTMPGLIPSNCLSYGTIQSVHIYRSSLHLPSFF